MISELIDRLSEKDADPAFSPSYMYITLHLISLGFEWKNKIFKDNAIFHTFYWQNINLKNQQQINS